MFEVNVKYVMEKGMERREWEKGRGEVKGRRKGEGREGEGTSSGLGF